MRANKDMKKKLIFVFITILTLGITVMTGCSSKQITQGEVINKEYTPAHQVTMVIPVTIYNGKTAQFIYVPYIYFYSDKWKITIQKWDEEQQKMLTAVYRVTQEVYDSINLGDEFVYTDDTEPSYPEYTRERSEE